MRLVRNWGRIGSNGQELVEIFDEIAAGLTLEAVARVKRRRDTGTCEVLRMALSCGQSLFPFPRYSEFR
ncbi:WGR domain-containing protein [Microvirga sp. BT689]|nr:WGR domain-containing protein [Microvirga arvi]